MTSCVAVGLRETDAPAPAACTAPARAPPAPRPTGGRSGSPRVRTGRRSSSPPTDIEALYGTDYQVHHNSARTGIRLIGPKPEWAAPDGGEAGLHPSNIHDTPYAVGAVDFTGDTPILLGPDGPALGGFVCPAAVVIGHRWKLGQLRPGDTVRFVPIPDPDAAEPATNTPRLDVERRAPAATATTACSAGSRRPRPARR